MSASGEVSACCIFEPRVIKRNKRWNKADNLDHERISMSEYQYYEFVAIDEPLTPKQMAELRSCSSRANITSTSFVNEYQWGDLS
jgi:hypothetical protein